MCTVCVDFMVKGFVRVCVGNPRIVHLFAHVLFDVSHVDIACNEERKAVEHCEAFQKPSKKLTVYLSAKMVEAEQFGVCSVRNSDLTILLLFATNNS